MNHIAECKESLECWASRRKNDIKSFIPAKQNIQSDLARYGALLNCLNFMENKLGVDFRQYKILDVGCATGYGLAPFFLAGFHTHQRQGIDLFEERIDLGKSKYPGLNLQVGDATDMSFPNDHFDMVMEQFCFCHILDDTVIKTISTEMVRVAKPGGYILIMDWIIGSAKRKYNGITKTKISNLFCRKRETQIVRRFPAKLAPPLGRVLSKYAPTFYPIAMRALPFAVLAKLTLLRRNLDITQGPS